MDRIQTLEWAGAIAGAVVGLSGGLVGVYFSITNADGPRERAFVIKASVAFLAAIALFLGLMYATPGPYRYLLWIPYAVLLPMGIVFSNRRQQRIREEEAQEIAHTDGRRPN